MKLNIGLGGGFFSGVQQWEAWPMKYVNWVPLGCIIWYSQIINKNVVLRKYSRHESKTGINKSQSERYLEMKTIA